MLSILPIGDVRDLIGIEEKDADVCILEEPEHLNVTSPYSSQPWTETFNHVVGVMHTNYCAYAQKAHLSGFVFSPFIAKAGSILTRFHCDKIIKLSDTLQVYATEKECVNNVHGIRKDFLEEGKCRATRAGNSPNGIYFIGKLLWAKGLDKLIGLENEYKRSTGEYFKIDIIGSGPEADEIQRAFHGRSKESLTSHGSYGSLGELMNEFMNDIPKSHHEFRKEPIPASFLGRIDHASITKDYKIFINPSKTEVLCTTTAEVSRLYTKVDVTFYPLISMFSLFSTTKTPYFFQAIAMGKFVIIPRHPSNDFFEQFPNCLMYKRKEDFISNLQFALSTEPTTLSIEHSHLLTWEAATERCIEASKITRRESCRRKRVDQAKIDKQYFKNLKGPLYSALRHFTLGSIGMIDETMCNSETDKDENESLVAVPVECE